MTRMVDIKMHAEAFGKGPNPEVVRRAIRDMRTCPGGTLWASGLGKSGLVAQKLVGTARCLGLHAAHIHPVDAFHGDAGSFRAGDILVAISASGETRELITLVNHARQLGLSTVSVCGITGSSLEQVTAHHIKTTSPGADPDHIPVASFISAVIACDMLAVYLAGDEAEMFHPGGSIGTHLRA